MLTLYFKPTCPFSRRVTAVIDRLDLDVEMKDIAADEAYREELEATGGKLQTPYLVDTDKETALYESDNIVDHLQTHYGSTNTAARPRVHVAGGTCVSCEG